VVPQSEVEKDSYDGTYVYEVDMLGVRRCIDVIELLSCWGRFINDPLDKTLVNAKAVVRGVVGCILWPLRILNPGMKSSSPRAFVLDG
jgi:hypothetical protein